MSTSVENKTFLFLQGPHGPFFAALGKNLAKAGATVWRVGFNAGDQMFWLMPQSYIPFLEPLEEWPARFSALLDEKQVTDIVLYGDTRQIHATAVKIAKERGLNIHVFEEGYIRPFWVTYERGGTNGNSRLMDMDIAHMQEVLAASESETALPPDLWGDTRQHVFYGATYHWFVMFWNQKYKNFRPHRAIPVSQEFLLYLKKLLLMPFYALSRRIATTRIKYGDFPYHLVLLQLEHDSSFQAHSPFNSMTDFLEMVIEGFAKEAPKHHHIVFKSHPLEDGRVPLRKAIQQLSKDHKVDGRVHFVRGGKLAPLLHNARSAITINSTAAHQALWRGLPLIAFGNSIYSKPEFTSKQSLGEFLETPSRPDRQAYRDFRHYLLETSQITGGFYSAKARRQLLRQVVDLMLAPTDPYDSLELGIAAPRQQFGTES